MMTDVLDSRYSWVVAICGNLMYLIVYGLGWVSGLLLVATINYFNTDRQTASFPFTFACALKFLAGPLTAYFARKFGIRFVTLFGCFLSFIGVGACFVAENITMVAVFFGGLFGLGSSLSTSLIPQLNNLYFKKHLSKANGLSYAGSSISGFIFPPLCELLLNEYGIKGTYLILAGLLLNSIPVGMFMKEPPASVKEDETGEYDFLEDTKTTCTIKSSENSISCDHDGINLQCLRHNSKNSLNDIDYSESNETPVIEKRKNGFNDFDIFLDIQFLLISLTASIDAALCFILPTILNDYSMDKGVSLADSTYLLMTLSITDLIGRLSFGWIIDNGYMSLPYFCTLCFFTLAVGLFFVVWSSKLILMFAILSLMGLSLGGLTPLCPCLITEFIKPEKQSMANASLYIFSVPLLLLTPSLLGYFRDGLGSYDWFVYILCLLCLVCCIMYLALPCIKKAKEQKNVNPSSLNIKYTFVKT